MLLTIIQPLLIMHAFLHTGSGAYYGWSVGAAVLALLPLMARLTGKKLDCVLLTSKHLLIGLFAMTCAVTWLLWYNFQACYAAAYAISRIQQQYNSAGRILDAQAS